MARRYVGISEAGARCGEDHPRARLTDREVDLVFALREAGLRYQDIADKLDVGKSTVADILKYRRRIARAVRWIRVKEEPRP